MSGRGSCGEEEALVVGGGLGLGAGTVTGGVWAVLIDNFVGPDYRGTCLRC